MSNVHAVDGGELFAVRSSVHSSLGVCLPWTLCLNELSFPFPASTLVPLAHFPKNSPDCGRRD